MIKRLIPLALFLTLLFPAVTIVRAEGDKPAVKEADQTELGKSMDQIGKAWRKLRKQVADPASNASSLELVATIKDATEKSLTLQPDKTRDLAEGDRAKYVEAYRDKMKEFIATLAKLADAIKAGDNPGAVKLVADLGAVQKEGHKEFKRPDK